MNGFRRTDSFRQTQRMNILVISAGLPDKRSGGLPAYMGEVIEELLARGHCVHYLNTSERQPARSGIYHETTVREDGLVITCFYNLNVLPDYGRGTLDPLAQVQPDPEFSEQFEAWLASIQVDVVHLNEFIGFPAEALSAVFRRGIPAMATVHDYYALCPTVKSMLPDGSPCDLKSTNLVCRSCCRQGSSMAEYQIGQWMQRIRPYRGGSWLAGDIWPRLLPALRAWLWRRSSAEDYRQRRERMLSVLGRLDLICGISNLSADLYRQVGCLNNVVAETTYTRRTVRHEAPVCRVRAPGEPLRILVLNVRRGPKGLALLKSELGSLSEQAGRNLRFLAWGCSPVDSPLVDNRGAYAGNQLDAICSEADFGLVPSVWREAYGFVGAEMLSRGLPLIASRAGAMKEYITEGHDGLLFDPLKPRDLAGVLNQLAADEVLQNRLLRGGADGWKKFNTFETHVDRLIGHYRRILEHRGQASSRLPETFLS